MLLSSMVQLGDVTGNPTVRMSLPQAHQGARLALKFTLKRRNGARTEELVVDGEFRVTSAVVDATSQVRQVLIVESVRKAPTWRAVRNAPVARRLGPTRFPPKEVR